MFYIFPLPGMVGDCCHFAAEKIVREKVSELIVQIRCKLMIELELGSNSRSSYCSQAVSPCVVARWVGPVFPGARSLVRWTHRVRGMCYHNAVKKVPRDTCSLDSSVGIKCHKIKTEVKLGGGSPRRLPEGDI